MLAEHAFSCPYCGEPITMVLELSAAGQAYIEDCEVCCRPIEIYYDTDGSGLSDFSAKRGDD